jgi:hypothetical protein
MEIGSNWTTAERAEVIDLCQRNHQLLLKLDFLLDVDRPLDSLSMKDAMSLVGMQIEQMDRNIAELEAMLRSEQPQALEGAGHD